MFCFKKSDSKYFWIQKSHGSFHRLDVHPGPLFKKKKRDPLEMTRTTRILGDSPLVFTCFAFCSLEPMAGVSGNATIGDASTLLQPINLGSGRFAKTIESGRFQLNQDGCGM